MQQVVAWVAAWARACGTGARADAFKFAHSAALLISLLLPALANAQSWQYLYDEVGRLKSAIAPSGERADYEYDAVGNIVAIRRSAAGALNISEFSPQIGKGGTSVKLLGSGFSTTLANNTVKFNGVTATVSAATATQLTVTAPNTGTTGAISVTVGAATVTTREAFVYSSTVVTAPPTITSITPSCAVPGNTVAITGTNFDVAPGATRVELGNVIAPTTVASPTSLSAVVPLGATSNTRVVTPLGISANSTQLFIPPVGACLDYETPIRPVLDGAASTINIATAGKKAVLLIAGNAGQALSLQFSNFAPSVAGTSLSYTIYNTANVSISTGTVATTFASIHMPLLPTTGMYAVVFAWNNVSVTGSAAVQLRSNALLSNSGAPLVQITGGPGQTARLVVTGVAGQDWALDLSALTLSTGGQYVSYQVLRSDGSSAASGLCYPTVPDCSTIWLGMTAGTHTVVLTPYPNGVTGSVTLKSWASSRVTGALTLGTAATYTSTVPGQAVQRTFTGTAGQQLGLALSNFTTSVSGATLNAVVLKPDGTQLTSIGFTAANTTPTAVGLDLPTLPTSGVYTVLVYPYTKHATTFSGQVLTTQDVTATLATNGTPTVINLAQPGQQARVTFTGVVGQDWALDLSALTLSTGGQYVSYQVLRSDGSSVSFGLCYLTGTGCSTIWLGMTAGTHTVVLTPYPNGVTGSVTLKSWASSRVTGALTLGTAATYTSTVPGQAVQRTFTGTAGQQLGLALSNFTTSVSGATLNAVVLKPDGTQLTSIGFTAANTTPTAVGLDLPTLPTSGVYTVLVYPYTKHATTFSGQVLTTQDVTATLATNGTPTVINLAQPGQQARVTFTGVVGQDWALDLSALTLSTGGQYVSYQVLRSDGVSIFSGVCDSAGCSTLWQGMTAGTHTIVLTPSPSGVTGSVTLKSWASSRVTGALTLGTAATYTSTVPGQAVQRTFTGTAGQQLGLALSNFTTSVSGATLNAVVLKPDGTQLTSIGFTAANTTPTAVGLDLPTLPTSGVYTVLVYPYTKHATTFSGQVLTTQDVTATLATNGTPTVINLAQPGQQARVTFTGVAGQDWALDLSALTLSTGGQYVSYQVLRSDGASVFSGVCYPTGAGCSNSWRGMTAGTHTVVLTPYPNGVTGNVTLKSWASSRVTGPLTLGTAATYTSTIPGQAVQRTFSGTAGQQLGLALSNFTTSVSGATLYAVVLNPNGTELTSAGVTAANTTPAAVARDLLLPSSGTYTVLVYPYSHHVTTFTGQVLVTQDVTATLATNGTPTVINLTQPGQQARASFTGVAGQDWTLDLSGLTLSTSGEWVQYQVLRSDGSSVVSGSCYTHGGGCSTIWLGMTAGMHTVVLTPYPNGVTGNVTLKSWASSRVTGALTLGTAATYTSTVPGQAVQRTFSGTAGQQLGLALSNFTTSVSGATLNAVVLKPDGTQLTSIGFTAANTTPTAVGMDLLALPTSGTYTVLVYPYLKHATTFSGQVLVTQDVTATLATNGTPTVINLAQPGQQARVTFTGVAGQDWALDLSALTLSTGGQYVSYQVLRSDGVSVFSGICYPTGSGCSNLWLGITAGTHTVVLTPSPSGVTGSVTLKSWASSRVTGTLTLGTAATYTSTVPGQAVQRTFSGTAGQQLGLALSNFTTSVSGATLNAVVLKPDGTQLGNTSFTASQTTPSAHVLDLSALPTTGTYTVLVHPSLKHVTTFSGQVLVTQDVGGTLSTDGTPRVVNLSQPGQQAQVTFAGVAGQDWILDLSGLTLANGGQYIQFQLLRSDGATVFTGFCTPTGAGCTNVWRGTTTGTHTVRLTPFPSSATGSVTLRSWASSRVTGSLTIGSVATYTSTTPGQAVQFTFNGTAGQQLGLRLTNFTTSITGTALAASVLRPDGVTIASTQFSAAETSAGPRGTRLPVLPTSGTYSVLVHPSISNDSKMTSTFGGQVSINTLQDVTSTLATNGTETLVTLPQPGQVARLTFAGTAGKDWALETRNLNLASTTTDYLGIDVSKPDASSLTSWSCNEGPSCGRVGTQLPTAGTYTVVTTPSQNLTGSFGLKLWLSSPVTAALTSGVASTLSTSTPGQRALFTFSGTAGQQLTLSLSGSTSIAGAMVSLIVLAPSGAQINWSGRTLTSTAVPIPLSALTQTGTYSVYLAPMYYSDPASTVTTFTASLTVNPTAGPGTDGGPLPTDNSLKNVTFVTPGETVDLSFNAANGDEVSIDLSQLVLNGGTNDSVQFRLVPPVGSPYSPLTCSENGSGCGATYTGLFYSGTYKLRLTAQTGLTGTLKVRARKYVPLTGTLFINSPLTVTTNTTGQTGRYTFDGTAGQLLRLSLSNASSATGVTHIGVYVFAPAPDYSYVGGIGVAPGGTQSTDLPALPSTGTYRIDFYGSPPGTFSVRALVAPR